MKRWEPLHLTLNNSISEEGQGDYEDKLKIVPDKESFSYKI